MVVVAADAGGVHLLGHGFRHCRVMLLYMADAKLRRTTIDMRCVDTIAMYLFYMFIIDFSLEMLDLIHRIYEADESFPQSGLHGAHQALLLAYRAADLCGTLTPIVLLAVTSGDEAAATVARKRIYIVAGCLTLIGIFAMRWNVVIGGQLFSKSFLGYTTYKMGLVTRERLLVAVALLILPLVILSVLVKLLPPWPERRRGSIPAATPAH